MPDPEVVRVMRQFKRDLLRGERAQMREMATRWLAVERRLAGQMDALAQAMDTIRRDGGRVSFELLLNDVRYRQLVIQLQDELANYTDFADVRITQQQRRLVRLGIAHAENAITAQGIGAGFGRLPVEAVEAMVGLAGNGSPLRTLLVAAWPDAADGLTQALINGVALGYNPRRIAREMARGSTRSLDRMMTVARSETLRVYRHSNLESYKASGVVESYIRLSARDSRVCAGCLAADSTEYPLEVDFKSHPNCRCTLLPKINGIPLRFQSGATWFAEQPAATQRGILGAGRYDLWASGQVDFADFATIRTNAVWGDAIVPTPLRELAVPTGS